MAPWNCRSDSALIWWVCGAVVGAVAPRFGRVLGVGGRVRGGQGVDPSVGFVEGELAAWVAFDGPSVFVEEPVVISTQQDQIVEVGGSPVGPMLDVVAMDPTLMRTSRESAATVPMPELTS